MILLLVLSIALSGLTSCTNSAENAANQTNAETSQTANNGQTDTDDAAKKNDGQTDTDTSAKKTDGADYPPIPVALAQAEVKKLDNSTFKLEEKKGSVILLNMWATWCGPCRGEMPHLVEMEEKYKSKNFEVIGLNTDDESVEDINKFAEEMKLNYTMAYADGAMQRELVNISKFQGIPQSFLIDREGRLRGVFLGGGAKVVNTMKQTVEKVVNEE
jgi:thiol-disulfide isomerase/thioredoxin